MPLFYIFLFMVVPFLQKKLLYSCLLLFALSSLTAVGYSQPVWQSKSFSDMTVVNLKALAKMYGYARYFYPNPYGEDINWYGFLMHSIEKIENVKDDHELIANLKEMFRPIIPEIQFKQDTFPVSYSKSGLAGLYVYEHISAGALVIKLNPLKTGKPACRIKYFSKHDKTLPVPDSLYGFQLKNNLYVYFPVSLTSLPNNKKEIKRLKKSVDKNKIKIFPGGELTYLFNSKKAKEKALPFLKSYHFRVADIMIRYNIVQHFYTYYFEDRLSDCWDSVLEKNLNDVSSSTDRNSYFESICGMMAHVKDSHLDLFQNVYGKIISLYVPEYYPEIEFSFAENQLYVKNISKNYINELDRGDVVKTVNQLPVDQLVSSKLKLISSSTSESAMFMLSNRIFSSYKPDSVITLSLEGKNGNLKTVEIKTDLSRPFIIEDHPYLAQDVGNKIWHVNLCHRPTNYKDFAVYISQLKDAKGIIFDVRGYPNHYTTMILAHLIDSVISAGNFDIPYNYFPDHKKTVYKKDEGSVWYIAPAGTIEARKYARLYKEKEPLNARIDCPIVFLTDAKAMSYAETLMEMVKHYRLGTIIGEHTAGTNGDIVWLQFPFSSCFLTGIRFTNRDGTQNHGIGIQPDIEISQDINKTSEDTILEYAKKYLNDLDTNNN